MPSGVGRPAVAPRIGIGVFYENIPLNFKGNPMPIGSSELTTAVDALQTAEAADTRIGGSRRTPKKKGPTLDFNERTKGDPTDNLPADRQLDYYLGDFGHSLLDALLDRMEAGEYGPVSKELMQLASRKIQRTRGAEGQAGGEFPPGGPGGEFGPGSGQPGDDGTGGGRPGVSGGGRSTSAMAGAAGVAGETDSDSTKRRFVSRATEKEAANVSSVKQLNPGIIWLGKTEDREDLVKRAEATGCDIMAVFHMTIREARASSLINTTTSLKLQCYRPNNPGGKWPFLKDFSSEPLINLTVETWRQKEEKGVDPVEREITKAIEAIDKVLKPSPLPDAVTAERAKKRIADLVAQKPEDPLPVLVEARFYSTKGLMTDAEYAETAKSLLGETGFEKLKARAKEGDKE